MNSIVNLLNSFIESGSEKSFNEVCCQKSLQTQLRVTALKCGLDDQEAEDIVWKVFMILWKKRKYINGNPKGYLFKCAFHESLKHLNSRKKEVSIDSIPQNLVVIEPKNDLISLQLFELIDLAELTAKQERAYKLHWEGYKNKEISEKMEIALNTVEDYLYKARKKLMNALEKHLGISQNRIKIFFKKFRKK